MEAEQAAPQQAPPPEDAHHRAAGVAEALLALPEPDAEAAWQQLPREALLAQVSKYRDSIRDVAARLRELGDASPIPATAEAEPLLLLQGGAAAAPVAAAAGGGAAAGVDPALDADAAGGGPDLDPEDADLLQLGDEGLDYTLGNVDDVDPSEWQVPPHCVPIHANVTTFDWPSLYEHCQFDVVMMDPPWQLATANPTRGVALGYSQLNDDHISGLPVPQLQRNGGFLFVWVINAKYKWTLDLFDKWGYRLVDEVVWVKMTVNRRLAKSHGYYLQHAKEVCLVAKCGDPPGLPGCGGGVGSDIIFSERRGQSQKPEEIYELIEQLVPNGRYLEIFARKNNLRDYWVSIGNEVTGTGLPEEDMRALKELNCIPGAVYGKTGAGGSRAASGGSGAAAATAAVAGDASGGAAAQGGRGTSGGSAGGAGAVRAGGSSGAGQVRVPRAPSPAARAPSPAAVAPAAATPAGDSGQSVVQTATRQVQGGGGSGGTRGSGGGGTAGQPHPPELRPRPPAASFGAGTAAAAAATPPTAQALEQQQPGTARPPSRLSLSIRRQAHQPHPLLPPPGATAQQQQPDPVQAQQLQQLQPPPQQQQPAELQAQAQQQGLSNGGGGAGGAADGAAPMKTDYIGPAELQHDASQPTPVGMSPLGLGVSGRGFGVEGELGLGFDDPLGAEEFGGRDINMGFAEADDWA